MKVSILFSAALGLAICSTTVTAQNQPQQQLQVGRFQALEASFSNQPGYPTKQSNRLVILDTATGGIMLCDYEYSPAGKGQDGHEYLNATQRCGAFIDGQNGLVRKIKSGS